jgi:DNA-binding transcriptional MerR regulator
MRTGAVCINTAEEAAMKKHYLLNEAAKLVGVPGYRISYAITNGHLPEPEERLNNHRLFTAEDIARIEEYFAGRKKEARR